MAYQDIPDTGSKVGNIPDHNLTIRNYIIASLPNINTGIRKFRSDGSK
jgi:hypothetical protein